MFREGLEGFTFSGMPEGLLCIRFIIAIRSLTCSRGEGPIV